ncbi:hypothetical protein JCM10207_007863 [Rhodosporidiobolus poonsookiae]
MAAVLSYSDTTASSNSLHHPGHVASPSTTNKRTPYVARLSWFSSRLKQTQAAFAVSSAAIGPAFGCFNTYASYQIQYIGYAVGANPGQPMGSGCLDLTQACRVPLAGSGDVNLSSFILYMNALAFAISGVLCFLVSGFGDYMGWKREQYICLLVVYGAFALPVAGMTAYNVPTLNSFGALYVVFNTVGFLAGAWQNIYIPEVMYDNTESNADRTETAPSTKREREVRGATLSVWGYNAYQFSLTVFYCITIGISFASATAAIQAGLWVTTASGALCIVLALVAWPFLPSPAPKPLPAGTKLWTLPLSTFAELWQACTKFPEAMKYLVAFTIYNDSIFAFSAVISQLFNLSLRPSLLEFTYFSLAGTVTSFVFPTIWLYLFRYTGRVSLRQWTIVAYAVIAFTAVWCLLGLSDSSKVGFKNRWEFYFFQIVQNMAFSLLSAVFRVVYSELFPRGAEVQYFSFQLAIGCATVWIPQVVDSAIVDATNMVRFPAIISLVTILIAIGFAWWTDDLKGALAAQRASGLEPEIAGDGLAKVPSEEA